MPQLLQLLSVFVLLYSLLVTAACSTPSEATESSVTLAQSTELDNRQACPKQRAEICTMIYQPVCATKADGSQMTASSDCVACSNPDVVAYSAGDCQTGTQH